MKTARITPKKGFTLVEIMIVVVIIGLLAALAIPAFQRVRDTARVNSFLNDIRVLEYAFEVYTLEEGSWPEDVHGGVMPPEMEGLFSEELFTEPTPIGGIWDYDEHIAAHGIVGVSIQSGNSRPLRMHLLEQAEEAFEGQGLDEGRLRVVPQFGWAEVTLVLFENSSPP